ncbi:MAG: cupredoxin domain-containing protein [Actinomycetota bacterium]
MLACLLVVLTAACGNIPEPQVQAPEGRRFIPMVPDSIDDVGLAPSVAVDAEGLPTISYFGFPAQLEEGEIPVARPVGSPFLSTEDGDDAGAVLLAELTPDQFWIRGAVAQPRESPAGVPVPFEPAAEPSLSTLTPARAKGTDLAIAGADIHTVWTVNTGVWYGVGPSFDIGPVEETPEAGAPSIVVDAAGLPIVAYTVAGDEPEVRVAERVDERWRISPVANLSGCGRGCPPATQIGLLGGEPLVVTADTLSGEVIAAHRQGGTWTSEVVATDATGGTSLATAGDTAAIAFTTRSGVALATGRVGSWSIEEAVPLAADAAGSAAPSTSVAVDGEGTAWVAWSDGDGIHLASRADGSFEEVELPVTTGGSGPSVAVTEDGASVYLAWYDPEDGDLRLGTYSEIPGLLIAAPSPLPDAAAPAPPSEGCEPTGRTLQVTAQGIAFDTNCLAAPAEDPFEIVFDNQDQGVPHNVAIYTDSTAAEALFQGETFTGVAEETYPVDPIDAGDYFFRCDVHPTQMTGTFVVAEERGGGGGGGGGGGTGGGGGGG